MKIMFKIYGADPLVTEHLKRSIEFDNVDLIFMARKSLSNLEKSRLSHLITGDIKMITDSMLDRNRSIVDNIKKMFNLDLDYGDDGSLIVTLFMANEYFVTGDSVESKFGRLGKRLVHFMSRQGIIDGIQKNLRETYGLKFVGEILDSDGKNLRIGANL